ncbi:MAG: glycosyltransferase family 4 protein [Elusimicrobia bacterium]|nr:glycosyltransferase family 4 protein [Elusimicrobiota bacterium]
MPAKITVAHVITRLEMGGAQFNTLYTASHLDKNSFQAELIYGPGGIMDEKAAESGVSQHRVQCLTREVCPLKDAAALLALRRLFMRLKPDVVHTHSSKAGILGRLAAKAAGVPAIAHTFHGFGFTPGQSAPARLAFETAERLCAPISDALIFVSQANMDEARSKGIGNPARYRLIRSGIELSRYPAKTDRAAKIASLGLRTVSGRQAALKPESRIVLTIGNLKPQKNPLDMVRIAALVCAAHPDAVFIFAGDGELRAETERLVVGMGLQDNFFLPGWRADGAELLSIADVYALSSLWEGLPRSLVEALKSGVPSVAYACDGVRDLLGSGGGAGYAIPIGPDAPRLAAEKIAALLADGGLLARARKAALETDLQAFDMDFMVKQQESLYRELLEAKKK